MGFGGAGFFLWYFIYKLLDLWVYLRQAITVAFMGSVSDLIFESIRNTEHF